MHNLIDSVFAPLLIWLTAIGDRLHKLSVPVAKPLNLNNYFGVFLFLAQWMKLVTTICGLSFIYLITYLIMANIGLIVKFKNLIKWW